MTERNRFLSPRSRYYGQVKPENLVFNANLQEFGPTNQLYLQLRNQWKNFF
jgi:hypothetical protein